MSERRRLAQAAGLIALGNVASRVLGLVRDLVISNLFGATGAVSAFRTAEYLPRQFYDLLIGGMVSSALVPVFSEYVERDKDLLWRLAGILLSLTTVVLGSLVVLVQLAAPWIARFLGGADLDLVLLTRLLRFTAPAMLFLSLSGVLTGLLYALKRFVFPAFTAATFNLAIVVLTIVGAGFFNWGIDIVAIGLVVGAALQVLIQLPGLGDARLRFNLNLRHPALRRILVLYQPVILGLVVTFGQTALDRRLANSTGESSLAWMQNATTLIQFPMGLVVLAVSLAILPTLSGYAAGMGRRVSAEFLDTLFSGLKIVLILVVPATVALFILAEPVINLLFQHGRFTAFDTTQTALALRFYLLGLLFAAIDQPLIFAFYARQNTLTPALVGIASVGVYLVFALGPLLFRPLQMTDLVLADSLKHLGHVTLMLWLMRDWGNWWRSGLLTTLAKTGLAAAAMALLLNGGRQFLLGVWPPTSLLNEVLLVGTLIGGGGGLYLLLIWVLRVEEMQLLLGAVGQKLGIR